MDTSNINTTSILNMQFDEIFELPNSRYISSNVMELSDDWDEIFEEIGNKHDTYNLYPPIPPIPEPQLKEILDKNLINLKIGDGEFIYVTDKNDREMLVNAWQAITQTNNWDFMAQDIHSFMFSSDPHIVIISRKMEELGYTQHSGCSFAFTMRNMQYLAQNGEEKFKEIFDISREVVEEDPYCGEYKKRLSNIIKRRLNKKNNK